MEDGRSKNGASRMVSKRKMSDEQFPTNLEGFGYFFNEKGQLRQIAKPDEGFVFEVKSGDKAYNQKHYEALGEVRNQLLGLAGSVLNLEKVLFALLGDHRRSLQAIGNESWIEESFHSSKLSYDFRIFVSPRFQPYSTYRWTLQIRNLEDSFSFPTVHSRKID